jgi:hypothetical protein
MFLFISFDVDIRTGGVLGMSNFRYERRVCVRHQAYCIASNKLARSFSFPFYLIVFSPFESQHFSVPVLHFQHNESTSSVPLYVTIILESYVSYSIGIFYSLDIYYMFTTKDLVSYICVPRFTHILSSKLHLSVLRPIHIGLSLRDTGHSRASDTPNF